MNYEIQFARITNAGKLPDRFLTCQHFESDDLAKSSMGKIFSLVEIISPWFPTVQTGQKICHNFAKYYFQGFSTSDVVNVENALKKINDDLGQITQSGETDWIGNLSAIFAVIAEGNLHLAPTGKVEGYLFRDGKINHLTGGLSEISETHPLKTFANTVSGELKIHDKVLLSNRELLSFIPIETIRQIVTLHSPQEAALQICRVLRKDKVKNVNLIIINLLSKEKLSLEPISQMENVFYLDRPPESSWWNLKKMAGVGKEKISLILAKILSLRKKIFKKKPTAETTSQEKKETKDRFDNEFISDRVRDDGLLKDEEIKYSPDLYVHYYANKKQPAKNLNFLSKLSVGFRKLISLIKKFGGWLQASYRDRSRRRYLYIALAIVIILIIFLVIILKNRSQKVGSIEAQKILDTAIAAQKEGKSLASAGKEDKAKEQLSLSIDEASKIEDSLLVSKDAKEVIANSLLELDTLTDTTRFNELKPILNISSFAKQLYIIAGQAYLITDNDIFEASIIGGTPSKAAELPRGKGSFLAGTRQDKTIFLYTNNQNLYQFDPSSKSLEAINISEGHWETANALAAYSGSLYLLDGVLGQIYKHSSSQDSFFKGQEYISAANLNLKNASSIAIDGSIYILKNDGQVIKLQKSKLQDFSLQNIPAPFDKISTPVKIFTDSDTPYIYLLETGSTADSNSSWQTKQKRILEFDKEGRFIHQYVLPENFNHLTDFVVSSKLRKIWLLEENSLYEIPL